MGETLLQKCELSVCILYIISRACGICKLEEVKIDAQKLKIIITFNTIIWLK